MILHNLKTVQWFADLANFFRFRRDIKREFRRRDSKFNQFKMQKNWLGNIICVQIDCDDTDLMGADYDSRRMMDTKLKPIVQYLSTDLEWGDYLVPQISNFVDEEGNATLSYGVTFIFMGYQLTMTNFLVTSLIILAAIITALCILL